MPLYTCEHCNISTKIKSHYNRHLNTKKHRKKIEELSSIKVEKVYSKSQKEPKKSQKEPKKSQYLVCEYCDKKYTSFANKRRHELHRCKNNNANMVQMLNDKNKYIKEIEMANMEMKKERTKLYKKIDELISKVGHTFNQNIILNNYGNEDMSHISDTFKTQLLKIPYMMIPKMIEAVHFNENKPENQNIAITNKNDNKLKVYKNNKWIYQNKKETINDLMDSKYYTLDCHFDEKKKELNGQIKGNYLKFKEYMSKEDKEMVDKLREECELVLLNNR